MQYQTTWFKFQFQFSIPAVVYPGRQEVKVQQTWETQMRLQRPVQPGPKLELLQVRELNKLGK